MSPSRGLLLILSLVCMSTCHVLHRLQLTQQRVLSELKDLSFEGLTLDIPFNDSREECGIRLSPIRGDLHEWHFSFLGIENSTYDGGIYHGRIILDKAYPRKAPRVLMYTPSGRWKIDTEICLSASAYHQELWDPSWNLRTLVLSLRGFMVTNPGEIGSLRRNVKLQRQLAANSTHYVCPKCNIHHQNLKHVVGTVGKFPTATTVATTKLLFRMDDAVAASADANNSNSGRRPSPEANQVQRGGSKSKSRVVRGQTTRALRRLQFMRKVVLYSGAALLLAGWKYCCAWLENYLLFGRDSLQSL